jgi:hypothetical protein
MKTRAIVIAALFAISFPVASFMFARVYAAQAPLSAKQQALTDAAKKEGVNRYYRDVAAQ